MKFSRHEFNRRHEHSHTSTFAIVRDILERVPACVTQWRRMSGDSDASVLSAEGSSDVRRNPEFWNKFMQRPEAIGGGFRVHKVRAVSLLAGAGRHDGPS